MEIRRLTLDDQHQAHRLGVEAFGGPPPGSPPWEPATAPPAGREQWGAFDDDELVAQVATHEYESWWHGARLPTCGVAGVSVSPEHRGAGLLQPLFVAALGAAAQRGEVVSTLYPTANGIYRGLGYELVSSFDTVEVPLAELARVRPATATRTRRSTAADVPALEEVYATWAAAQNGPLTRTGPRFAATDQELLDDVTAVTLAVDRQGRVVGFASWDRGSGYDPATASIEVHDLVAVSHDGYRALWGVLASYSSVVGRLRLHTSGEDPARLVLPTSSWKVVSRHPYMLRVSDPAGAFSAVGLDVPGLAPSEVRFAVRGDRLGTADGDYRLTVGDGPGACVRVPPADGVPVFTPQGLAMLFAGAQSCANLRMTSDLSGPADHDRLLDALLRTRPVHVRDYF